MALLFDSGGAAFPGRVRVSLEDVVARAFHTRRQAPIEGSSLSALGERRLGLVRVHRPAPRPDGKPIDRNALS